MFFLLAFTISAYANAIAGFRSMRSGRRMLSSLHHVTLFVGLLAFPLMVWMRSGSVDLMKLNAYTLPWLIVLFGTLTAAIFSYHLYSLVGQPPKDEGSFTGSYRIGLAIFAVLAGVYMAGTAIDHLRFVNIDSQDDVGVADLDFLGQGKIACGRMSLIRIEADSVHFRCPTMAEFGAINQPFIPWPDYRSGESHDLKEAVDKMRADAAEVNDKE